MENYTYIKLDIQGFYIDFNEMFDPSLNNNIGSTYNDFLDNKWVLLSAEQVAFRNEHPNATVKEVWDMALAPMPPRTIEEAKEEMQETIDNYDKSPDINGFTVNGSINGWFTPEERSNYKSSIDSAKIMGVETLAFFIGDIMLEVPTSIAEEMLAQLQLYADQCFIVTKQHKAAVEQLTTIEEVDNFPYMEDYPPKINFAIDINTDDEEEVEPDEEEQEDVEPQEEEEDVEPQEEDVIDEETDDSIDDDNVK